MKYAVIGTGAIGGYYGGMLAQNGMDVHFLLHSDYQHVNEFVALDTLRDTLKNHFVEVDIVCETIELKYQSVQQLTQDLKQLGASNHNAQAAQGLMGVGRLRKMVQAYESLRDDEGQLPVSYEIYYIKAKTKAAI